MLELLRFITPARACSYLPAKTACLEHRIVPEMAPGEFESLLDRGWRRMGCFLFRPACPACSDCRSLRVHVAAFAPTQSQRRTARKNQDLRVVIQRPTVSHEHLRLWRDYHTFMQKARNWPESSISTPEYADLFLAGDFSFSREFLYYDGAKLVGVGLVDETPNALSSIYFFHDPAYRTRALGVHSILAEVQYAQSRDLQFLHLGYWIEQCPSMAYKANYRPHEILRGSPSDDEKPIWTHPPAQSFERASGNHPRKNSSTLPS